MELKPQRLAEVEARTQELGRQLYAQLQRHRPSLGERLQDWLMLLLMEDPTLRTRLLRFVDVLAALTRDRFGRRTSSLFREYFRTDLPRVPLPLRLTLSIARSPLLPDPFLAWLARRTTKLIASRFIVPPGSRIVGRALQHLEEAGRYPSFDLLGEAVVSEAEAKQYRQAYLDLLDHLGRHPMAHGRTTGGAARLEISLKLSSLTSQFNLADPQGTLRRVGPALQEICQAAQEQGIGVTVDAEQHAYRELTWYIFQKVMAPGEPLGHWPDAGIVVQAYHKDAVDHAGRVIAFARHRDAPFRVRLVKGAYWDYEVITAEENSWPVPVYRDKSATDQCFERIARILLEDSTQVQLAVGSHSVRSHAYAQALREALGLPESAVEHQTLYRTLEALSHALAQMGWVSRDYVPVGELIPGMAYLIRRVLENTSQVGFLTKTRLREDATHLLRPPQLGQGDPSYQRPTHPSGFENTRVTRLFDPEERRRFQDALQATRARWEATYPLQLGNQSITTSKPVHSLSPSHPDPAHPVGWVHHAGSEETERAIALANNAFPAWASRPLEKRVAVGLRVAEALLARKEELAAWVVHEGGRNWPEALADVEEAIDHVGWNARQLARLAPQINAHYQPRGVVACIPPWNFPCALPAGMASAALLAGNTVILKSAGPTPVVAQALVDAFHQAGVPKEALIHLPGPGATVGARLLESPDVDMVAFTGSKRVGITIYRTASSVAPTKGGIKRVVAEMGGKNSIIVFPDADMDEAVLGILRSAFGHAGQKCSACSRVLVHRELCDRLTQRLVEAARSLPIGPADDPGTAINPIITQEARQGILAYGEVARQEGRVLLDLLESGQGNDWCLGPMLLEVDTEKAQSARVSQEEIFGPILPIIFFRSEEEAVSIVNSTVYALALGIFSRSPSTIARMIRACRAGNVYVNRGITGARVGIEPFGGFQLSGTGPKAGSEEYLLAFLTRRTGFRTEPRDKTMASSSGSANGFPTSLRAWEETPVARRLEQLSVATKRLAQASVSLEQAIASWKPLPPREASSVAANVLKAISSVLAAAPEIAEPQPTVIVPGQKNFILWNTPRGVGIAVADDGADPASLAALIFGPLLAGNGLLVATTPSLGPLAQAMAESLWRSGVPRDVLTLAPPGASLETLAAGPVHFAAVDLALDATHTLYRALGVTKEEAGQRWLKALISMADGPSPGEPGFLRLFAHPKTVAIQTLHHGADLELL